MAALRRGAPPVLATIRLRLTNLFLCLWLELSSSSLPLQRKALTLLRRIAAWYLERPGVQAGAARAQQAGRDYNSQPLRRRQAERTAAELAAMPGAPLCPCGCGEVG